MQFVCGVAEPVWLRCQHGASLPAALRAALPAWSGAWLPFCFQAACCGAAERRLRVGSESSQTAAIGCSFSVAVQKLGDSISLCAVPQSRRHEAGPARAAQTRHSSRAAIKIRGATRRAAATGSRRRRRGGGKPMRSPEGGGAGHGAERSAATHYPESRGLKWSAPPHPAVSLSRLSP